jgi:carboxylesterase
MLYEHGYNVLIPRAPLNGLKDRLNNRQEYLTAEELAECADEALDIAAGLGEKVTVLGFSMGGVQATWAAVNRHDIDTAVIISPALGVNVVPAVLTPAVLRLTRILPNRYLWWDKQRKASFGTADMYPRFSTHALAEMLRLAEKPRQGIPRPKAHRAIIVTNACDRAINNTMIYAMTERWRQKGKTTKIITYEFESSLDLTHEIIAPLDPDERIDFVHEKLFELITANGG